MLSTAAALEDPDVCQHQGSHSGLKATCHWVSLLGLCGGGRQGRRQLLPSCQPSSYRHMLSLQSLVKRKMVDIVCVSSHKCTRARAHTQTPPPHTHLPSTPCFPPEGYCPYSYHQTFSMRTPFCLPIFLPTQVC